jgi:hypothetical protein
MSNKMPLNNHPPVSCIMPTANRRAFVPRAVVYFLRQDYPNKELVIKGVESLQLTQAVKRGKAV